MRLRGYIHIHSDVQDGAMSFGKLASWHRKRGYDFLCITDHPQRLSRARFQELVAQCDNLSDSTFTCIYGLEGRCASGLHVMAIGVREFFPLWEVTISRVPDEVHSRGGIAVLAHPSPEVMLGLDLRKWDGVEVWNGLKDGWAPNPVLVKLLRARWRTEGRAPYAYGGPDAHQEDDLLKIETVLATSNNSREAILDCLKDGRFAVRRGWICLRNQSGCGPRVSFLSPYFSTIYRTYRHVAYLAKLGLSCAGVSSDDQLWQKLRRLHRKLR